jgi:hypothetical protein
MAEGLAYLPETCGGKQLSEAIKVLNDIILGSRKAKLTKSQYVMFLLADMITWCETADALCRKAAAFEGNEDKRDYLMAASRLFVREAVEMVYMNGLKITQGCDQELTDLTDELSSLNLGQTMKDNLKDMDTVKEYLFK